MKTILAAIDFSPVSSRVISQAVALARTFQARVVVFNAIHPPVYVPDDYGTTIVASALDATRSHAIKELSRIERDLQHKGIEVQTIHAIGHPATLVLDCAKKVGATYIVIGSHGHTALFDLVVGSTTHVVLKRAPCPVLVVPSTPAAKPARAAKKTTSHERVPAFVN